MIEVRKQDSEKEPKKNDKRTEKNKKKGDA